MRRPSPTDVSDLAEAVLLLAGASLAIRLLPFHLLVRLMGTRPRTQHRTADLGAVGRAVRRASRRVPWRTVCFQEGLATHWMLRRRGADARLHYGIRQAGDRLSAHVWVDVGGVVVIGEEEQGRAHQRVAVFPAG